MIRAFARVVKPKTNVYLSPLKIILEYELPGVLKENLSVDCLGRNLVVKAEKVPTYPNSSNDDEPDSSGLRMTRSERTFGKFERQFELPMTANVNEIDAKLTNGVLTITVPCGSLKKPKIVVQ